jgi:hypothetical protein
MAPDLNIPAVEQPGFALRAVLDPDGLRIRFTGSVDARAAAELEAFVRYAHAEACRLGVREVAIDLNGCSFINSSCLKAILGWLAAIGELAPEAQYKLRFVWNTGAYWQRRGLQALQAYAPQLVEL